MHVLVCSVGGSPEPVRKTIDLQQPEYIIYIASPDSRRLVWSGIEDQLLWKGILDKHVVTLKNYQDLLSCVRDMRDGIDQALKVFSLSDPLLVADITGGTKVMSAALTLVMMEYRSRFTYIGGQQRTKGGLGIVESGHEECMKLDNPWEVMALREVQTLARLFNEWQFEGAARIARELAERMDEKAKVYQSFEELILGYRAWDAFSHKMALTKIRQAIGRLEPFTMVGKGFQTFLAAVKENAAFLEVIQQEAQCLLSTKNLPPQCGKWYLADLVGNAVRRAAQGRYDDAVARLYSAIEKTAKIALLADCGIDNSNVDMQLIPEGVRHTLGNVCTSEAKVQIGLKRSFLLLNELGHPLGERYLQHEEELDKQLQSRNMSLLAHGYTPVSRDAYEKMLKIALEFLRMREEDVPRFFSMEWRAILL